MGIIVQADLGILTVFGEKAGLVVIVEKIVESTTIKIDV